LAPNNEIEDRFSTAVKSALDESGPVTPAPEATAIPVSVGRPRRSRTWAVALLCLAFAAVATIVIVTILHVRRGSMASLTAELAAISPGNTGEQPNPTAVAPESAPIVAASATAAASANAAAVGPQSTAAAESTPTASSPTTPAATPGEASELQQPLATPSPPSLSTPVSKHLRRLAEVSGRPSISTQTYSEAIAAAPASAHSIQSGLPDRSVKAQPAPAAQPSGTSSIGEAKGQASASAPSPAAAPASRGAVENARAPAVVTLMARVVLVSSPDHSVYWALEDSGTIFRSTDRTSWQKQGSGVQSDLLAGQAPSNTVCWVVGRHGTILLTTDGKRWQRIKSPTTADIVGVSALSADVADIVVADGSHLSTIDRGGYWMPTI